LLIYYNQYFLKFNVIYSKGIVKVLRLSYIDLIFQMTITDIREIITKHLNQEASAQEISMLSQWVEQGENKEVFKKIVQADFFINYPYNPANSEIALAQFLSSIKNKKNKKAAILFVKPQWLRYAAVFVVMLSTTAYFVINRNATANVLPLLDSNAITIQLDNGEIISVDQDLDTLVKTKNGIANINMANGVLQLNNISKQQQNKGYHTLRVPNGKVIAVTLQDGSNVKLNSGSELKYPISFAGKNKREVFLKGEAFFTIAKDQNKPFLVNTHGVFTKVFGTEFNVSAYETDVAIEVVLVEGSVGVGAKNGTSTNVLKMIKPSQKLTSNNATGHDYKIENVDVTPYISWTRGIVVFQNEQMSEIIKKLERRFNVSVINKNETLSKHRFTGVFNDEDINLIMKTIQTHTHFNFVKEGNIITIKK
jgi:transmembrane sensor